MVFVYVIIALAATPLVLAAFFGAWTQLHRWLPAFFSVLLMACNVDAPPHGIGGSAGSGGSDAGDAPTPCATAADCQDTIHSGQCAVMACDPTGSITPDGCYVKTAPVGTACEIDAGAGTCQNINGGVATVCTLPP